MKIKELSARILLLFATLLTLLITISGTLSISKTQDIIFQLIFLPVTLFFIFETIQIFFSKKNLAETLIVGKKKLLTGLLLILVLMSTSKTISILKNKEVQKEKESPINTQRAQTPTIVPSPTTANIPQVRITTKNPQTEVNLREHPTTSSKIIKKLKRDETYSLISNKEDWYEIKIDDNLSGWVFKDYVKLEK